MSRKLQGPIVLAVSGKARHGKDTVADYLVKTYGFEKYAVANPIKEICKEVFSFDDSQVYGDNKETVDPRWGVSPRKCMQFIGTELFRDRIGGLLPQIGSDIWIHCLVNKLSDVFKENPNALIVVSDVRFENEWKSLKSRLKGAYSVRINNPRVADPLTYHVSENMEWGVDFGVENNGTLPDLYQKVDNLVDFLNLLCYSQE